ncbi:MAG: RNA polymerase sigma factor [Saprospiraceae bacterium]
MTITDETLIEAIKAGNQNAFRKLVETYQGLVANTCYGLLQNASDAEDVSQEVFIQVYRSIHKFRGDSKLSTWLYRIATTRSIDLLRKRKRRSRVQSFQTFFGGEEAVLQVADNKSHSPQQTLENQERAKVLAKAVAKLPESQQVAFTLSKYEDLSYQQIADIMDRSLSSIESLLFRAKKNLRKYLEEYYKN